MAEKKWVLVTGASTGIGRAIAEHLAENGFGVYASARNEVDIQDLNQIENVVAIKFDVTRSNEIDEAYNIINNLKTGLFAIINNAGIAVAGPLMDVPDEEFEKQLDVSVLGVHRVTKKFFPLILKSKGRIVMMSSDSGFFATPIFGPYCSAKFALEGYSDSLRRELLLTDVKVIIIQPGRISTPIWDKGENLLEKYNNSMFAGIARQIGEYAIRKGKTAGLPPIDVAKLVHNILIIKKPKIRYLIAPNTRKYKIIKALPARLVDKQIKKELEELK